MRIRFHKTLNYENKLDVEKVGGYREFLGNYFPHAIDLHELHLDQLESNIGEVLNDFGWKYLQEKKRKEKTLSDFR